MSRGHPDTAWVFTARAGIVPHRPVPLLMGRDSPIFHQLWNPEREARARRNPFHRGEWKVRPAYGATRVPRTPEESTAEDQGPEESGPSPPDLTRPTTRGAIRTGSPGTATGTPDTVTASEQHEPQEELGFDSLPVPRSRQFASAQIQTVCQCPDPG